MDEKGRQRGIVSEIEWKRKEESGIESNRYLERIRKKLTNIFIKWKKRKREKWTNHCWGTGTKENKLSINFFERDIY